MHRSHAYMKPASDSIISTLVGFSRAQFNDAYFWSHSNCAFGYGLHTAFHGGTYRALYASRRSRCDSSDRAVELCAVCAVQFSRLAGRQCGYLRFLSEPPLYFSSCFFEEGFGRTGGLRVGAHTGLCGKVRCWVNIFQVTKAFRL